MPEKLEVFCVLEQKEKYQILKETMKEGESPEECLARTFGGENSAPFSWKTRGILTLVREEKPTEYMLLFSARRTLPEGRKDRGGREDLFSAYDGRETILFFKGDL